MLYLEGGGEVYRTRRRVDNEAALHKLARAGERLKHVPTPLIAAALALLLQASCISFNSESFDARHFGDGDSYTWLSLIEARLRTGRWSPFIPSHNAPYGLETHLTRPFAEMVRALAVPVGLFLPPKETALVAGMLSGPTLYIATAALLAWGAGAVLGTAGTLLSVTAFLFSLAVVSGPLFSTYQSDHHGLHVCLTTAMMALLLRHAAGERGPVWLAAGAGAVAGMGVWSSVEMLLPVGVGSVFLGVVWVYWGGARRARGLWFFTLVMTIVLVAGLSVERSPGDWVSLELDRLSGTHVIMGVLLASATAGLVLAQRRYYPLRRLPRGALAVVAAASVVFGVRAIVPDFFRGPYAAVDGVVQEYLFSLRGDRGAWSLLAATPGAVGYYLAPLAVAVGYAAQGLRSGRREAWLMVLVGAALTAVSALWTFRLVRHGVPFVSVPLGGAASAVGARLWKRMRKGSRPVAGVVVLSIILSPYLGFVVADLIAKKDTTDTLWASVSDQRACDWSSLGNVLAGMPGLRGGTIVTHPHHGAELAYLSGLGVVATGCHCNGEGLADTLAIFLSAPDAARTLAQRRDVEFIMQCPAARGIHGHDWYIARSGPDGLYARLARGRPPDWLIPVPVSEIGMEGFVIHRTIFTESTRKRVSPVPME